MSEIEYFSFDDLDFLLKRDWFLSVEDIHDLLGYADDDTFWQIYSIRREYSQRVREVVAPLDYVHDKSLFKFTVNDLTDEHIQEMQRADRASLRKLMQEEWEKYMKSMPARPRESVDERIDEVRLAIETVREELRDYRDVRKCGDRKKLAEFDQRIEMLWAQESELQTVKQKTDSAWLDRQRLKYEARLI